uniref:Uncharacterized protein n=1 Tax=Pithovirus LCPAC406 TaxID=2506599 RepID=A0A481ZDG8_9VIRU|nr:MAG: hypothetical protein LCPAC406_02780 [Pithovirus LCPAC406]
MSKGLKFKVLNKEGDYSHFVRLTLRGFELDGRNMLDKDKILISGNKITIAVNYPLNDEYIFDITIDKRSNFTRFILAKVISKLYQLIYREEKETSILPIESMTERYDRICSRRPKMMNGHPSCEKYDIWDHDLGDLVLRKVYYDSNRDLYTLGIDSQKFLFQYFVL